MSCCSCNSNSTPTLAEILNLIESYYNASTDQISEPVIADSDGVGFGGIPYEAGDVLITYPDGRIVVAGKEDVPHPVADVFLSNTVDGDGIIELTFDPMNGDPVTTLQWPEPTAAETDGIHYSGEPTLDNNLVLTIPTVNDLDESVAAPWVVDLNPFFQAWLANNLTFDPAVFTETVNPDGTRSITFVDDDIEYLAGTGIQLVDNGDGTITVVNTVVDTDTDTFGDPQTAIVDGVDKLGNPYSIGDDILVFPDGDVLAVAFIDTDTFGNPIIATVAGTTTNGTDYDVGDEIVIFPDGDTIVLSQGGSTDTISVASLANASGTALGGVTYGVGDVIITWPNGDVVAVKAPEPCDAAICNIEPIDDNGTPSYQIDMGLSVSGANDTINAIVDGNVYPADASGLAIVPATDVEAADYKVFAQVVKPDGTICAADCATAVPESQGFAELFGSSQCVAVWNTTWSLTDDVFPAFAIGNGNQTPVLTPVRRAIITNPTSYEMPMLVELDAAYSFTNSFGLIQDQQNIASEYEIRFGDATLPEMYDGSLPRKISGGANPYPAMGGKRLVMNKAISPTDFISNREDVGVADLDRDQIAEAFATTHSNEFSRTVGHTPSQSNIVWVPPGTSSWIAMDWGRVSKTIAVNRDITNFSTEANPNAPTWRDFNYQLQTDPETASAAGTYAQNNYAGFRAHAFFSVKMYLRPFGLPDAPSFNIATNTVALATIRATSGL